MKSKVIVGAVLFLAMSLVLSSCAAEVSQEEYEYYSVVAELDLAQSDITSLKAWIEDLNAQIDGLTNERDAARSDVASLKAEIQDLNAQIEDPDAQIEALASATVVEEAWDLTELRYTILRQNIPFLDKLMELAPWLELPEKPTWLDSVQVISAVLVDEPPVYEGVCIVTAPDQQIFMRLAYRDNYTSVQYQGGSKDIESTITWDDNGAITKIMGKVGESLYILDWTRKGPDIFLFGAILDDHMFEALWPEEPRQIATVLSDFVGWLETINRDGGLYPPSDQLLMFIALGELSKPPRAELEDGNHPWWARVAQDLLCGSVSSVY